MMTFEDGLLAAVSIMFDAMTWGPGQDPPSNEQVRRYVTAHVEALGEGRIATEDGNCAACARLAGEVPDCAQAGHVRQVLLNALHRTRARKLEVLLAAATTLLRTQSMPGAAALIERIEEALGKHLVLHVLRPKGAGVLCGMPGIPGDWPKTHRWIELDKAYGLDFDHLEKSENMIACPDCLEAMTPRLVPAAPDRDVQ